MASRSKDAQGTRRQYVRDRSRSYRSIFGAVTIERAYYYTPGSPGVFPLDGELNMPDRGYFHVVLEFSSRLAVTMSFEDAQRILNSFFPAKVLIRYLERTAGDLCDEVDQFCEEKPPPDVCPNAPVTVATVDKKGIVIRKPNEGQAASQTPPKNPEKPGKKEMATAIPTYVSPRSAPRTTYSQMCRTTGRRIPSPNLKAHLCGAASRKVRNKPWPV